MDVEATVTNEPGGWRSPGAHFVIWPTGALTAIPYKHFQRCDLRRLHQMSFLSCVSILKGMKSHFRCARMKPEVFSHNDVKRQFRTVQ